MNMLDWSIRKLGKDADLELGMIVMGNAKTGKALESKGTKNHAGCPLMHKVEGVWQLTSTDVEGFTHALNFNNRDAKGNVLIIGAGATARAVIAACDGVSGEISVVNRSPDRELAIRKSCPNSEVQFTSWESTIDFEDFDLVVNTTPGNTAAVFVDQVQSASATYFEVLYNPWPTQLLAQWRKVGGYGIDGLDLLIHQAISQASIFTALPIDRGSIATMLRLVGERELS